MDGFGVYAIVTPADSVYVGMTMISFESRWYEHLKCLKNGSHRTRGLKSAYEKYGWENLEKIVLEDFSHEDKSIPTLEIKILHRERYWWEQFFLDGASMLHGRPSGRGSVIHTQETKEKMSETARKKLELKLAVFKNSHDLVIRMAKNPSVTRKSFAEDFGVSMSLLKKYLTLHNISWDYSRQVWDLFQYPILSWYLKEGLTMDQIAQRIGCGKPIVVNHIKNLRKLNPHEDWSSRLQRNSMPD